MDIFDFRNRLVAGYSAYTMSFIALRDRRAQAQVEEDRAAGFLWPEPRVGCDIGHPHQDREPEGLPTNAFDVFAIATRCSSDSKWLPLTPVVGGTLGTPPDVD